MNLIFYLGLLQTTSFGQKINKNNIDTEDVEWGALSFVADK